jgi:hypothetical protein
MYSGKERVDVGGVQWREACGDGKAVEEDSKKLQAASFKLQAMRLSFTY